MECYVARHIPAVPPISLHWLSQWRFRSEGSEIDYDSDDSGAAGGEDGDPSYEKEDEVNCEGLQRSYVTIVVYQLIVHNRSTLL